jgi:hypothetical protein
MERLLGAPTLPQASEETELPIVAVFVIFAIFVIFAARLRQ